MQSQLILQFRGPARTYFDQVENASARLIEALGTDASLDGEDVGPHGANLFIFTGNAPASLARALLVFPVAKSTDGFGAACRQVSSETFRVLWPEDAPTEFRLR